MPSVPSLRKAFPYQEKALDYLAGCQDSGLLFMEMRLGKTLSMARHIVNRGLFPLLVSCPKSVRYTWVDELVMEGVDPSDIVVFEGTAKKKAKLASTQPKVLIATYQGTAGYRLDQAHPWRAWVADETYLIAKLTARISLYFKEAPRPENQCRFALCGNPAAESELDFVNQYMWCKGNYAGYDTAWEYIENYWKRNKYGQYEMVDAKHRKSVKKYVSSTAFCLTRKEAQVGGEKIHMKRYVDIPHKALYDRIVSEEERSYWSGDKELDYNPLSRYSHLLQICSGMLPGTSKVSDTSKVDELVSLVTGELAGQQVVVFSRFIAELKLAHARLSKVAPAMYIDGSVPSTKQQADRKAFLAGNFRFACLEVDTCRMGLNFSSATVAIYLSNSFSGDTRAQSEDRIIHPEATDSRLVIDLVCRRGADDFVSTLVRQKNISSRELIAEAWKNVRNAR